jgi:hypothetical protein
VPALPDPLPEELPDDVEDPDEPLPVDEPEAELPEDELPEDDDPYEELPYDDPPYVDDPVREDGGVVVVVGATTGSGELEDVGTSGVGAQALMPARSASPATPAPSRAHRSRRPRPDSPVSCPSWSMRSTAGRTLRAMSAPPGRW